MPALAAPRAAWLTPGPKNSGRPALLAYSLRRRIERWGLRHMDTLNGLGASFTLRDLWGAPGDTLLAATVARQIKERWPRLRINFITKNPDLVQHDPNLSRLNAPPTPFSIDFWYYDLMTRKDSRTNLLAPMFKLLGLAHGEYRARVYLTEAERAAARERLAGLPRPLLAVSTLSAQPVKNWPLPQWQALVPRRARSGHLRRLAHARQRRLRGEHQSLRRTALQRLLAERASRVRVPARPRLHDRHRAGRRPRGGG
jgi:hypothetical protein